MIHDEEQAAANTPPIILRKEAQTGPPHSLISIILRARGVRHFLNAVYVSPSVVQDPTKVPKVPGRIREDGLSKTDTFHPKERRFHRRFRRFQRAKTLHWLCIRKLA